MVKVVEIDYIVDSSLTKLAEKIKASCCMDPTSNYDPKQDIAEYIETIKPDILVTYSNVDDTAKVFTNNPDAVGDVLFVRHNTSEDAGDTVTTELLEMVELPGSASTWDDIIQEGVEAEEDGTINFQSLMSKLMNHNY